jgi:hypothetical protein
MSFCWRLWLPRPAYPRTSLLQSKCSTNSTRPFDPIDAAGEKGDAAKAEWEKAKALADVELASDLNNPIYN